MTVSVADNKNMIMKSNKKKKTENQISTGFYWQSNDMGEEEGH